MSDDFWSDLGEAVATVVVTSAIQGALNRQKAPNVTSDISWQQPLPPCTTFAGGYSRTAGAVMFKEAIGGTFDLVLAISDGRLSDVQWIWLADDKVTGRDADGYVTETSRSGVVNGDGRYVDGRVQIKYRLGAATETAFAEVAADFPALWTSSHRGDGTGTLMVRNLSPKAKFFAQAFPNGKTDTVGVAARGVCFDWRDNTQARNDPTTWKPSSNNVVWLVHLESQKWGVDWDAQVSPVLADLTAEANICDEAVALNAGGTEPRYSFATNFSASDDERDVRARILAAMDGFYTFDALDRLVIRAGKYRAPNVVLAHNPEFGEIISWTWTAGVAPENAVSQIDIKFTDPASDYNSNDVDSWIVGDRGKPDSLDLTAVTSWTQARRLAKRRAARVAPAYAGTVVTDLRGMKAWAEQYVTLSNPDEPSMDGKVVEIVEAPQLDLMSGTVTFQVAQVEDNIDAWNPATEEGIAPIAAARSTNSALAAPVITAVAPMYETAASGSAGARLSISATFPARGDLVAGWRWKPSSQTLWTEGSESDSVSGAAVIVTGFVSLDTPLDVQVEYLTGGNQSSDWSATFTLTVPSVSRRINEDKSRRLLESGGVRLLED